MGWEADLEAKHRMPLDQIPGHVYVLHYDVPQIVKSVGGDYAGPCPGADGGGFLSATQSAITWAGRSRDCHASESTATGQRHCVRSSISSQGRLKTSRQSS
jgi:hypothetical protein